MSEDLQLLLTILAGFYLLECCHWVRPGCLVFVSWLGERAGLRGIHQGAFLRNDHGGVLLGNLFPPGASFQCQFWPVSLSPAGIYSYVAQASTGEGRPDQPARYFGYDEIHKVTNDQNKVLVNERLFVSVCSPDLAQVLVGLIRRLTAMPKEMRNAAIDQALRQAMDTKAVADRYRQARRQTFWLRLWCSLMMVYLFGLVPFLVLNRINVDYDIYFLTYGILLILIQIYFRGAARALWSGTSWEVTKQGWIMLISPADAMHAADKLMRSLLSPYHPLAVAQAVCSSEVFRNFSGHVLRDLRHPIEPVCPTSAVEPLETEQWFRQRLQMAQVELVRASGLNPDECYRPPFPDGDDSKTYCPRCLGQFVLTQGTCHCCGGIPLQSLWPSSKQVE